jgi:pilus assembly protein Flp/PilA
MRAGQAPRDRGATAIEYGLVVALLGVVVLVAVTLLGTRMAGVMAAANCAIGAAGGSACASGTSTTAGGMLADADWCPASSSGAITCRAMNRFNTTPWSSLDMTLSTTAALTGALWNAAAGRYDNGYGLWVRASMNSAGTVTSGYTFQVDPGAGNNFLVRQWSNGAERTIGIAAFPSGFDPTQNHQVSVSIVGDRLTGMVDGTAVVTVASLSAAASNLGFGVPAGTSYGIRTWGQAGLNMQGTSIR